MFSCSCFLFLSRLSVRQLPLSSWSCQRLVSSPFSSPLLVLQCSFHRLCHRQVEPPDLIAVARLHGSHQWFVSELWSIPSTPSPPCSHYLPHHSFRANHHHHDHLLLGGTSQLHRPDPVQTLRREAIVNHSLNNVGDVEVARGTTESGGLTRGVLCCLEGKQAWRVL